MKHQYTIRSIPPAIDAALRRKARQEAKSLNAIALESLARGLEIDATPPENHDLDHLIGSWQEDPGFESAVAVFEQVDEEMWK